MKLKVWGTGQHLMVNGKQHRVVVGAYSVKQVAGIAKTSPYIVNTWWAKTGNPKEVETATRNPFTIIDMGAI